MKKFENRKALFNEILLEVYKFHMNYKEEINKLNINIKQIITQHSNKLQTGVAKRTLSKYSNEDPFSDQLISNSVQQMVTYFMNKYSLISEEAEEIKNLIPKGNTEDNNKDKEYLKLFKQEEQKINSNLANLTKAKNRYYSMMTKLEEQISKIEENKKKLNSNNSSSKNIPNIKTSKTKKEKKEEEKEKKIIENQKINPYMVEEIVRAKEAYMLALDTLNLTKREYLNSINSYNDTIKEYDNNENDLLNQLLDIFEKYDEKIRDKNKEVSGVILENKNGENENKIFIEKINKKYEFEEYIPQHNKIDDNIDLNILSEMNKLTGYNIEESFSDPKIKKEIKFILSLENIINDYSLSKKPSIDAMKEYLNDIEYINKFIKRLNKARVDKELDKNKDVFDNIVELFNYILNNLILDPETNHNVIKNLLILTQSFYINDEKNSNKKIFFSNKITTPKEFKTAEFWIKFIEKEIDNYNLVEEENNKKEENKEIKEEIKEENKNEEDKKEEIIEETKEEEKEEIKEENKIEKNKKEENIEEKKEENIEDKKEEKNEEIKEEIKDEIKEEKKKEIIEENKIEEKKEENKNEEIQEDKIEEKKEEIKEEKIEEKKEEIKEEKNDIKKEDTNSKIKRNKQNEVLMVFIGNIANLNDYLSNQSKMKKIFEHFDEIYNFSKENIKKVSDILGFNIK